ncbi:hypothetical protein BCR34DRAFT_606666 [Clohesyomyces aquaticus]|uniref:Uncharacterized protein n=1 Tax=Clohesyomyces aquaticus TaxID=1231657 RepID=A0A1Y1YNY3_9PLEO|nr:hypothetical protein BCR34DRAFT_606666 [Clohesyomyces aquaticus]
MADYHRDDRRPLIDDAPTPSAPNTANNTPSLPSLGFTSSIAHVPPPNSPPKSRPGYTRLRSDNAGPEWSPSETLHEQDEDNLMDDGTFGGGDKARGLGIASPAREARRVSIQSIPRVPIGRKSPSIKSPPILSPSIGSPPNTGDPLFGGFPRDSSAGSTPDLRRERLSPRDDGIEFTEFRRGGLKKHRSSESGDFQHYLQSSDTERLRKGAPSLRSAYESDFRPTTECPTAKDFYQSRFSWLSITIIILCLFSTVFSAIFLGLAWNGPRYGRHITSHGPLTPAGAIILTSVMAKLIELSFVTSFVAFLGQVLSRRAFMKDQGRGVTLSELSMWRWVVQPGTLITHWETAKYSGLTILGILSLLSATLATLYAPASTALVQPMLKDGRWEKMVLAGQVKSSFANTNYVKEICETPIQTDPEEGGSTCLQIEHAAQGYHNYQRYLAYWKTAADRGNGTADQTKRPPGFALMHENTTVTPKWINIIDTKEVSKQHKRAINNVSLAFPHSGMFQAARDARNGILQPEDLKSGGVQGMYTLRGSVPSPVMHVLCANMKAEELKPIVYAEWDGKPYVNITTWTKQMNNATTNESTVVDDIFGWTKKSPTGVDYPPVFAKLPQPFNTIMNHTSLAWGRESIYLLGRAPPEQGEEYVLCQIKATVTPLCSTTYTAGASGGYLAANCDKDDDHAFIKSVTNATKVYPIPDWRNIGFDWSNSMSLNTGIMDANASNSRLLTQLIMQKNEEGEYDLNEMLPSPAEALAVMSGCTLLMSFQDTPFVEFWNYSAPHNILKEADTQYFNASLQAQQYASGGVDNPSKGFLIVLLLVFLMNIFVLIYFLFHRGLVTDFSEPPNLFALAVNSPPSHLLAGSCGGGPEGRQYTVNWFVNKEGEHLYMEPGQLAVEPGHTHTHTHTHGTPHMHSHSQSHGPTPDHGAANSAGWVGGGMFSALGAGIDKLRDRGLGWNRRESRGLMRPVSVVETDFELEDGEQGAEHSRTSRQYAKLAKRRSML